MSLLTGVNLNDIHQINSSVTARMLRLVDYDDMFRRTVNPVIVNSAEMTTIDFAKDVADKLFVENEDGIIDHIASCDCGFLQGNYSTGAICSVCSTEVKVDFVTNKNHRTWISVPSMITGVLHPVFYNILADWTGYTVRSQNLGMYTPGKETGKLNLVDAIIDQNIPLPLEVAQIFPGRGFNYFYDNFDKIVEYLATTYKPTATKKNVILIRQFIKLYRKYAFATKLPVLAAILQPITKKSETMRFVDAGSRDLLNAVHEVCYVDFVVGRIPTTEAKLNRVMCQAYKSYMAYTTYIISKMLGEKPAIIRQHATGGRLHMSFRSVIVPISGAHRYDELHIPWGIMVNTFRLHIINRLEHLYGMPPLDAYMRTNVARMLYDKDIHDILNTFIADYPGGKGIPTLLDRPPTLQRGSEQFLYVTYVKPNPDDKAIGISPLIIADANADFDGDALSGVFILESDAALLFKCLHPSERILDKNNAKVSKNIALTDPVAIAWNNMLNPY